MATLYYPSLDLIRIDANGFRVVMASTTISAYNVTAAASLGTLASDANGVIVSGSFTATAGDIVRLTHATYPGEHYIYLKSTKEEAFSASENAPVFVLENLYTNTNESQAVHLYAQDTENLAAEPFYIGTGKLGETASIPIQSAINKTFLVRGISEDIFGTKEQADFNAIASQSIDVPALLPEGSIIPYVISEFTTGTEPDLAAAQAEIGTVNPAILRFDMPVTYTGASTSLSKNIFVEVEKAGMLTVSSAATTVTINSLGALPDTRQIFAGAGKVVLGPNATHEAHLEWWAGIESSGNDNAAMTQALLSTGTGNAVLRVGSGEWCVSDHTFPNYFRMKGVGNDADAGNGTIFKLPAAVTNKPIFKLGESFRQVNISDCVLSIESRTDGSHCFEQTGVAGQSGTGLRFTNVSFYGIGAGAELVRFEAPTNAEEAVNIVFDQCTAIVGATGKAFVIESPNTNFTFIDPAVTMGVGSYAFYLERTGMVTVINHDIRGPAPSGSLYDANYSADRTVTGSITSGQRTVTLSAGTFEANDLGQYIGAGAWLAYIREITSSTTALVSFQPSSTITNGTLTIYRFGDHPNLAYCSFYCGPASMGSLAILGSGADEAVDYTYIGGQAHYAGAVTFNGTILQGRVKFTASMRMALYNCKWFAGAFEVNSGADVMVDFYGGYNFATTCYQAALVYGTPWSQIEGVVRCSNEFYISEEIHVNPLDYGDVTTNWSKINRPEGMEFHAGYVGDAVTDPVVSISAAQSPPTEKELLRLGHRDHTHPGPFPPWLYYYDFRRSNTDGALEITGNQTGFVGLRMVSGFLEASDVRNTTIYAPHEELQVECETAIGNLVFSVADNLTANRYLNIDLENTNRTLKGNNTGDETATRIGALIAAASALSNPADTDLITVISGGVAYKTTIAELKTEIAAGTVNTANSPNANEFARFTGATTIEGRTITEARGDLLVPYTLFSRYADATTTGTTEETLYTNSIAINTLATNGDSISAEYSGILATNVNEKYARIKFAGTTILDSSHIDPAIGSNRAWEASATITRVSNTVVRCAAKFTVFGFQTFVKYTEITSLALATTAYDLVLTGETPDLAGDITAKTGRAVKYPVV